MDETTRHIDPTLSNADVGIDSIRLLATRTVLMPHRQRLAAVWTQPSQETPPLTEEGATAQAPATSPHSMSAAMAGMAAYEEDRDRGAAECIDLLRTRFGRHAVSRAIPNACHEPEGAWAMVPLEDPRSASHRVERAVRDLYHARSETSDQLGRAAYESRAEARLKQEFTEDPVRELTGRTAGEFARTFTQSTGPSVPPSWVLPCPEAIDVMQASPTAFPLAFPWTSIDAPSGLRGADSQPPFLNAFTWRGRLIRITATFAIECIDEDWWGPSGGRAWRPLHVPHSPHSPHAPRQARTEARSDPHSQRQRRDQISATTADPASLAHFVPSLLPELQALRRWYWAVRAEAGVWWWLFRLDPCPRTSQRTTREAVQASAAGDERANVLGIEPSAGRWFIHGGWL